MIGFGANFRGQITVQPRCPACGSADTVARRSKRIPNGIEHQGRRCQAQRQWRLCRRCAASFPALKIGGPLPDKKSATRCTGPGVSRG